jgi:aryl-alcohol dehydrogenase-like predicted oxidoreductase
MPSDLLKKLVLGTVQLGIPYGINNTHGQPTQDEANEILSAAFKSGIRTLDTADAYGSSTERIGEFHRENPRFRIITKFSAGSETNLSAQIEQSLSLLHVDTLYCYQYHRFSDYKDYPALRGQLLKAKDEGKIQQIGISVYTNDEFLAAADFKEIDVIQFPFNILDNMNLRRSAIGKAKLNGKELHARSVFLQGLFFKRKDELPKHLAPLGQYIESVGEIAEENQTDIMSLALGYVLKNPHIDHVLFGVETSAQLLEIIQQVQSLPDEKNLQEIDSRIHVREAELLNPANWAKL